MARDITYMLMPLTRSASNGIHPWLLYFRWLFQTLGLHAIPAAVPIQFTLKHGDVRVPAYVTAPNVSAILGPPAQITPSTDGIYHIQDWENPVMSAVVESLMCHAHSTLPDFQINDLQRLVQCRNEQIAPVCTLF